MPQLPLEGIEQLVEVGKRGGFSGFGAELSLRLRIETVVECQLQDLRQVEVAGQNVGLLAEGPHLDTAAAAAGPGVLERFALPNLLLHHCVGVENGGEAVTLAHHPECVVQQSVGSLA